MSLFNRTQPERTDLLFSTKALVRIIVPLIFQQVLNITVGTVDTIMVAYSGEAAVSGVSLVNSLDAMLVIFFTALVGGGAVVVAQTLGRKNEAAVREAVKQLIYCTGIFAVVLSVVVGTFRVPLLNLLFGNAEPVVMESARRYFFFVLLSFPFLSIQYSVGASFRAAGNTMIALVISFILNVLNAGGNAVFIIGLKMGAAGAGLATLIARIIGSMIMLVFIHQKRFPVHVEKLLHYKPDFQIIRQILHVGVPHGIESAMFNFGRLMTQSLISSLGTSIIAANAVALSLANYQYLTGTACSSMMIAVVGRCIGAKEEWQAKFYSRKILFINYAMLWTVGAGTVVFLNPLLSLYHLSAASAALAKSLLLFHTALACLIWPLGFMLPSAFRAASDVRFTLVISTVSMWVLRVASAYVLALDSVSVFGWFSFPGFGLGISGVWIAMYADWALRCSCYFVRFVSGRWLKILHERKREEATAAPQPAQ